MVSFGFALLVFYIATKPPPPKFSLEVSTWTIIIKKNCSSLCLIYILINIIWLGDNGTWPYAFALFFCPLFLSQKNCEKLE
jgi:hypothetical protein